MRKICEILRLNFEARRSVRQISASTGVPRTSVSNYLARAEEAGIGWPLPADFGDDESVYARLFPHRDVLVAAVKSLPSWPQVHVEVARPHVTLMLLWQEYKERTPGGLAYSRFCERYQEWRQKTRLAMRQIHRYGEKVFVDFSGGSLDITDPVTGELSPAKLFVAVLGGSSYTYVEPVLDECLPTWLSCHVHAFEFYGGCSEFVVPDNLRAAVTRPCRYDPDLNRAYAELAQHYGVCVLPARVRRPKDKAKVEAAVQVAQRWILAVLRDRTFHSLGELREAIRPLLEKLNSRVMRHVGRSRLQLFLDEEKRCLRPLPPSRYEYADWASAKINIDYHVEFDRHYYSVPYQHRQESVEIRATGSTVEVLLRSRRIASHVRSYQPAKHTTVPEHMPKSHQRYLEWTPSRLISWAEKSGPSVATVAKEILDSKPHPEQGFRACLGIMRLGKRYGEERLERACKRAVFYRTFSYRSVESILRQSLDAQPLPEPTDSTPACLPRHENIRGSRYYQ
jgi:transposase